MSLRSLRRASCSSLACCIGATPAWAQEVGADAGAPTQPSQIEADSDALEAAPAEAAAAAGVAHGPAVSAPTPGDPASAQSRDAASDPTGDAAGDPGADLDALPDGELAEVTVIGTRVRRAPGSVHVIAPSTLERYRYDDVHAALKLVPGVYVRQEDGFGLRPNIGIRGALSDRSKKLTLMEDGVLFAPAPYSASAAYYFPMMPRIAELRVIKGPAAIAYGPQTIGGAIDLVTRPIPFGTTAMLDGAVGQYGYGKLHGYAGTGDLATGVLVEGVHVSSDGFKELPSGADTGFIRNEWMFKGRHHFDPLSDLEHSLALKLTYSEEVSNETYLGLTDSDFRQSPLARYGVSALDRMEWHHTSLVLTHRIDPTPRLSVTTNVYRHDFHRTWRKVNHFRGASLFDVLTNPNTPQNSLYYAVLSGQADATSPSEALYIGPNDRDFISQGIESRFRLEAQTGPLSHRIEYGLRLHNDRVDRRHSEDAYLTIGGQLVPEGSPTIVTAFNGANTLAAALHGVDAISWGALTLTPGLRVELLRSTFSDNITGSEQGNSAQVFLPGVGAYLEVAQGLGVLAGVYRGMSPPAPGAEPQIEPEISVNLESGVRYAHGKHRAELIGYYNDYSNLTDVCTFSTGCVDQDLDRQFDAGHARVYGLEAFAEEQLEVGPLRFPLSLAYTLTLAEFLETFQSEDPIFGEVEAGDEMPYVPRHQLRINAAAELGDASGYVSFDYVSVMREEAGSGSLDEALTTDAVFSLDAGLAYDLHLPFRTRLYLQGRNLTDTHALVSRRPYGARPNAPRWLQAGMSVEF